jgi:hypothetical protein
MSQATRIKQPLLVAETVRKDFTANDVDAFMQYVERLDDATINATLNSPEDVYLRDDDGTRKSDGYRMTYLAFQQMCSHTAAGLLSLAADLSGLSRRGSSYDSVVSMNTAVRIVNACIKLRFRAEGGLYGRQLISNTADNTVDGIVGPAYRYLAHRYLFEAARDMLEGVDTPAYFYDARITGRRVALSFQTAKAVCSTGQHEFYLGFYFSNSEAGECGVHSAITLHRHGTAQRCVGKLYSVAHSGRNFTKKLGHLLNKSVVRLPAADVLQRRLDRLQSTVLDLTTLSQRAAVAKQLSQHAVNLQLAQAIVDWTANTGGEGEAKVVRLREARTVERTLFDLFMRIIAEAEECPPKPREELERLAFQLFMGSFVIRSNADD